MIPNKIQHGDNLASLFEKFNAVIDYLREIRLVAGKGIRLNKLAAGTAIESTVTAAGGGFSASAGTGRPFDVKIFNDGTDDSPLWKARIFDSIYNDGSAGGIHIGTQRLWPDEAIITLPPNPNNLLVYIVLRIIYSPTQSGQDYDADFIPYVGRREEEEDDQTYYHEIAAVAWENSVPVAYPRITENIVIINRWT